MTDTNGVVEGRGDDSCELHIDGDFLFMAFGLLGRKTNSFAIPTILLSNIDFCVLIQIQIVHSSVFSKNFRLTFILSSPKHF